LFTKGKKKRRGKVQLKKRERPKADRSFGGRKKTVPGSRGGSEAKKIKLCSKQGDAFSTLFALLPLFEEALSLPPRAPYRPLTFAAFAAPVLPLPSLSRGAEKRTAEARKRERAKVFFVSHLL